MNRKGLTLIELLMSVLITGIVSVGIFAFLGSMDKATKRAIQRSQDQTELQSFMSTVQREFSLRIRESGTWPLPAGQRPQSFSVWTSTIGVPAYPLDAVNTPYTAAACSVLSSGIITSTCGDLVIYQQSAGNYTPGVYPNIQKKIMYDTVCESLFSPVLPDPGSPVIPGITCAPGLRARVHRREFVRTYTSAGVFSDSATATSDVPYPKNGVGLAMAVCFQSYQTCIPGAASGPYSVVARAAMTFPTPDFDSAKGSRYDAVYLKTVLSADDRATDNITALPGY